MIPYGRHVIDEDDIQAVAEQMRSGWLTQGAKVEEFEAAVAAHVGAKHAVAVSSGTAALHLACLAAGVSPGDRVATSAISFVASANCARYAGAEVLFCDIERDTLNMDAARLRELARAHAPLRAVIPVHMAGLPCDMAAIREAASGSTLIEDAAHALGASYESGGRVGSCRHSDMTVFSFHPVKSITTGEGGMVTTNRPDLYRRLLRLRSHGINKGDDPYQFPENSRTGEHFNRWYYEMQELGYNFRLTDVQAALGLSQLRKLERFLERRRALAARYESVLASRPKGMRVGQPRAKEESARHLFIIRAPFGRGLPSRAEFMHRLYERGYVTQLHYIPIPMQPYYARLGARMDGLPQAKSYYHEGLSIPLYAGLTDQQQSGFLQAAEDCLQ